MRIFRLKREEVAERWRRLHNEEYKIKMDKIGGECDTHGRDEKSRQTLI
jgi:hypothetical protein